MYQKHIIGKIGEDISCEYLQSLGYKILERNFLCKQGEIDIIALDKKEIVFVEVKTRTNIKYGQPIDAVNIPKQKHIYNAVKYYTYIRNLENEFMRIDVIEIYIKNKKAKINYIKQAM